MFDNYQIIITNNKTKKSLLKTKKSLSNTKIYAISEFNKLYYFDYPVQTIYYVMSKYHIKYEIAKIYLDNLYYITDQPYQSPKLNFLSSLKKDLLSQNYLTINPMFKKTLSNQNICIYNLLPSKEIQLLIEELKLNNHVIVLNDQPQKYNHSIKEFPDILNEVEYVINSICQLLKQGIALTNIYITNLDNEYRKLFKRLLPMFNIPYTLDDSSSIYSTFICSKFLELYSDNLELTLTNLKQYITDEESETIYNQIIDIVNKYILIDDLPYLKEMIIYDLKKTKLPPKDIPLSLHEASLKDTIFKDDDYIFVLSFNQGIIPTIYKDESYLTDIEKQELGLSLTIDNNNLERLTIINKLNSLKNLTITYKLNAFGEVYYLSTINEILQYPVEQITTEDLTNSHLNNQIKLTALLDEYYKYGTKSNLLYNLNNTYPDLPYKTYNHQYQNINTALLNDYLNSKLSLSYTSLDTYYRCPFSYYVGNILKLNIYEETFPQIIGTLFHSILQKIANTSLSYDELWNQELNNLNYEFNSQEKFFLPKLKKELLFTIETIKKQDQYTNLTDKLYEERIVINLTGPIKITFTGIIDKLKYKVANDQTIIAIIDYKTGTPNLDLNTTFYGIGMQLPIYLYLAKNSSKLHNIKVAGFYLQHILNNEVTVDKNKTYEEQKADNLLLQGYSNADFAILKEFDTSFVDSKVIKSMRLNKNNDFSHYAKVMTSQEMAKLVSLTEEKIQQGAINILQGAFPIAPKKIAKENLGCKYCKFKDICFHNAKDIVELEPIDIKEILKEGETNELD